MALRAQGETMKKLLTLAFLLLGSQQLLAQNKWIEAPSTAQPPQLPAGKRMDGEWVRVIDGDTIRIGRLEARRSPGWLQRA